MASSMITAHDIMEDTSVKVTESTQAAISTVKRSGLFQNYVMPVGRYIRQKYSQSPTVLRVSVMSFGLLSAIPVGCFMAFMSLVTLGCVIVGGIAFTIVEGGFAVFGSAFLFPALGVVLLISGSLGLFASVMYVCYMMVMYVVGVIWGAGQRRGVQRSVEGNAEKARQTFEA
ncbi:hypothetical protein BGX28_002074 [Mortierella sp. GBA30]|nr:hypothetical protein BGX28_002074 [Mortierella sp. GBA30]